MNLEKRKKYIKNIYATLHTLSGHCSNCNTDLIDKDNEVIKSVQHKKRRGKDEYSYYLQLNPNKVVPGDMIRSYSKFQEVLIDTLDRIESTGFSISRADLAFNSDEFDDFELFKKLNRLLICCISDCYGIKNCYQTSNLWTFKSLSIAIKSDRLECENYDKSQENPNVKTKSRLELRSKRMTTDLTTEFQVGWSARLDAAVERFESVQERYNRELAEIWKEDQEKPEKQRDFISVTAFLMNFRECLFTRKQLRSLLELMGVKNPTSAANKFKDRHAIEFFSKTDLIEIVKALKDAMNKYFES